MAKLLYQGHGSYRITTSAGAVIYVDPYAGEGYDLPADLVLVTHDHHDHNVISLVPPKEGCTIITQKEALADGVYHSFSVAGVKIDAVSAYNSHHKKSECVGYVLDLGDVRLYASGDTSTTQEMETQLPGYCLDYALLPIDGIYNMNATEAVRCAELIKAKKVIPIHMKPGALFDRVMAESFHAPNRMIVEPGEEIQL